MIQVPTTDEIAPLVAGRFTLESVQDGRLVDLAKRSASLRKHVELLGGEALRLPLPAAQWLAAFDQKGDFAVILVLEKLSECQRLDIIESTLLEFIEVIKQEADLGTFLGKFYGSLVWQESF